MAVIKVRGLNPNRRSAPGVAAQRSGQSSRDPRASKSASRHHGLANGLWDCSGTRRGRPPRWLPLLCTAAAPPLQGVRPALRFPWPRPRSCSCARRQSVMQNRGPQRAWSSPCSQRSGSLCSQSPCVTPRSRLRVWRSGAACPRRRDGASPPPWQRGPLRQRQC